MEGKRFKSWAFFALTVVLLLSLITGCAPTASTQAEIKVGAPLPLTGPYSSDGEQMQRAIEMAIDEINDGGGLLGRKIRLITGDVGALEAEKIQAIGERLKGEKVDFVVTGYDDGGTDVHVFGGADQPPYLHSNCNSLDTGPVAENPDYRNVFQYCGNEVEYGIDAAATLFTIPEKLGWTPPNKKVATIKVDYSYNIVPADKFNELAKQNGYEVVVDELTQFGVVEWGPVISKIEETQPSFITFWNIDPTDAARFMIQLRQRYEGKSLDALVFMQFTPATPEFRELAGEAAEGLLWSSLGAKVIDVSAYDTAFEKKYGDKPKGDYGYMPYDAVMIWAEAVKKAGCVDCYDKINQTIRDSAYKGIFGTYKFRESDQSATLGADYIAMVWYQIWDGVDHVVVSPVLPTKPVELPPWIAE